MEEIWSSISPSSIGVVVTIIIVIFGAIFFAAKKRSGKNKHPKT